jgi:hypothetical protein
MLLLLLLLLCADGAKVNAFLNGTQSRWVEYACECSLCRW